MNDLMVRLEKSNGQTQLVVEIPPAWEATVGEAVTSLLAAGNASTTRIRLLEALLTVAEQRYFWTPEWQAGEAEVDAALAGGRYSTFDTMDAMLALDPILFS